MNVEDIKKKVLDDVDPVRIQARKREMRKQRILTVLEIFAIFLVVGLGFYWYMGMSSVSGDSMYPSLHDGDIVFYKRHNSEYRQGDVVAIMRPDGEEYVKRVIAVAGDTVNIQNGDVYVNGKKVETEEALGKTKAMSDSVTYPLVVEDKEVFVLGDNREISKDSREFGTVNVSDIKGKILWYFGKIKKS